MRSPPETVGLELVWSQIQGISELTFGTSLEGLPEDLLQKGWDTSGSTAKAEVSGLMTWHIGEYDPSQAPWCMILVARPKLNRAVALSTRHGAVSRSVAGITVDESATWAWVGLYKMGSWIDPRAPKRGKGWQCPGVSSSILPHFLWATVVPARIYEPIALTVHGLQSSNVLWLSILGTGGEFNAVT